MKRFVTEYTKDGIRFGGEVDAIDWDHAKQIASQLNPPHEVTGVLYAVVKADHWTGDDAGRFTQATSECGDEPPDSNEFDQ